MPCRIWWYMGMRPVLAVIVVVLGQEPRSNSDTRSAHPIEFLYQMVAVERGDAALCAKVSPNATFVASRERPALLQSTCYLHLAFNTRQAALCDSLPRAGSSPLINEIYDSYRTLQRNSCGVPPTDIHERYALRARSISACRRLPSRSSSDRIPG